MFLIMWNTYVLTWVVPIDLPRDLDPLKLSIVALGTFFGGSDKKVMREERIIKNK